MWNKDEVDGKIDKAKGKIKETVGESATTKICAMKASRSGSVEVQEAFGKGRRKVGNAIRKSQENRPVESRFLGGSKMKRTVTGWRGGGVQLYRDPRAQTPPPRQLAVGSGQIADVTVTGCLSRC